MNGADNAPVLADIKPGFIGKLLYFRAHLFNFIAIVLDEVFPTLTGQTSDTTRPVGFIFVALILLQEFFARYTGFVSQTPKPRFKADQTLINGVKLVDQRLNAIIVERQFFYFVNDLGAQFRQAIALCSRKLFIAGLQFNALVLQAAQFFIGPRNHVKTCQHFRLQFHFHGRQRQIIVIIVVIFIRLAFGLARWRTRRWRGGTFRTAVNFFGFGTCESRVKIDDIAQQNLAFVQFIAPDDNRLKCQRAFAQACNHSFATRLNALGNRYFAFARQQFHGTHFAQIHAHRIIRAVGAGGRFGGFGDCGSSRAFSGLGFIVVIGRRCVVIIVICAVIFDDGDTHFRQHGHNVFYLLGGKLLRRQNSVQRIICHKTDLFGGFDHPLDLPVVHIDKRAVACIDFFRFFCSFFRCHLSSRDPSHVNVVVLLLSSAAIWFTIALRRSKFSCVLLTAKSASALARSSINVFNVW